MVDTCNSSSKSDFRGSTEGLHLVDIVLNWHGELKRLVPPTGDAEARFTRGACNTLH